MSDRTISEMTGGCACGKVRFSAKVDGDEAYLCHCRMCQRASGSVSLAMTTVELGDVEWTGAPDWYDSSPIAERPFCGRCGTTLGFRYKDGAGEMDLTVASFDDPSRFTPKWHFGAESINEAWLDTGKLKRIRSDDYKPLVERWEKSGEAMPE